MAPHWRSKPDVRIVGIDLAALPKNPTGICIVRAKNTELFTLHEDDEILAVIRTEKPQIVAIDAPLMDEVRVREADRQLKKYGAMPPTMPSMRKLVERARQLVEKINCSVIEVFPTATAKILGVYSKNWREMAEKLRIKARNKHELDAYLAAYTAYLYLHGRAREVGEKEKIVIPKESQHHKGF